MAVSSNSFESRNFTVYFDDNESSIIRVYSYRSRTVPKGAKVKPCIGESEETVLGIARENPVVMKYEDY